MAEATPVSRCKISPMNQNQNVDVSKSSDSSEKRMVFRHFDGVNVLVVVTGDDAGKVQTASSEIGARMIPFPEDGRFDLEQLEIREVLYRLLAENRALNAATSAAQARGTELISRARAFRRRIIELGAPDPGLP